MVSPAALSLFRQQRDDAFMPSHASSATPDFASPESSQEVQSTGTTAGDVSAFIFIHTVLSAVLVSSTWYLAYLLSSPTSSLGTTRVGAYLSSILATVTKLVPRPIKQRLQTLTQKVERTAQSSTVVQKLQARYPKLDGARIITSYVEAKVVRLFFKPITVPWRLWASWKLTKGWGRFWESLGTVDEMNDGGNFKGIEQLT
mmetsp:Transcript_26852/g.58737  ORF Transcript_26852/g.58737 Transcript_26852/m.58737 type:complete len:201 (+) Transcript_26852:155-757(+)